ncbi:MAG TPA: polyamine ABC transporter ATP-binding protein, partial [Janthinobacterium sp.]|nr:polyamine ABC transporter ATP-binding protein [Janthinobacterium sp.]
MPIAPPAAPSTALAADPGQPFLLIDKLVKEFDGVRAVDDISVAINKG